MRTSRRRTRTKTRPVELPPGVFFSIPAEALPLLPEGYSWEQAAWGESCPRTKYHEASDAAPARAKDAPREMGGYLGALSEICAFTLGYHIRQNEARGLPLEKAQPDGSRLLRFPARLATVKAKKQVAPEKEPEPIPGA